MNRRSFLKTAGAAGAFGLSLASTASVRAESKKIPIAVQVYSVRDAASKDLPGVLKQIAEMGYQGVEFAGTYGHSAEDVKKMLDDTGLVCMSTHLGTQALLGDAFDETVAYNKTIGNTSLMVAGGLSGAIATDAGNQFAAYLFNELAAKAQSVGCRIGFHAHGGDFTDIGGKTAWELFFERTCDDVVAQMDIGNCLACGADPYEAIKKFPGRGKLIHVKSCGPHGTLVGDESDQVDWPKAFDLCESVGGVEWYIVEQENWREGSNSLEAIAGCLQNLKKMGKC